MKLFYILIVLLLFISATKSKIHFLLAESRHETNSKQQSLDLYDTEFISHEFSDDQQPSQQDIEDITKIFAMMYGEGGKFTAVTSKSNVLKLSNIIMAVAMVVVFLIN